MSCKRQYGLHYAGHIGHRAAEIREVLATDIESVKGVCTIGTELETVILRFGEFLTGFVFMETVAADCHTGRLDGENKVIVILSVEIWRETVFALESPVDKMVLFLMAHRVAEWCSHYVPAMFTEFVNNSVPEVDGIDRIVGAKRGSVVIEYNGLTVVMGVIPTKIIDERGDFTFIFHIKGFEYIETSEAFVGLAGNNPVDIGIVVHAYAYRPVSVKIAVGTAVKSFWLKIETYIIKILKVTCIVFMVFFHRGVETIAGNADFPAHYGSLKRKRRKVALHIAQILFAEELHVFD